MNSGSAQAAAGMPCSGFSSTDSLLATANSLQNFSADLAQTAVSDMSDYGINEWL
jgi:hypothetical protein